MNNNTFYEQLPALSIPLTDMLAEENFASLPDDWHAVIADIRNSTAAVAAGTHNDVNLVAAGSLIAALNVARKHSIEIPFFFGGDGGNVLVPEAILQETLTALRIHGDNSARSFGLSMHVGSVQMKEIRDAGHEIRLAKSILGTGLKKAVLVGDGLLWAERQIKKLSPAEAAAGDEMPDMKGLECRWDRIKPPQQEAEVVCYLIEACEPAKQIDIYREVLLKADELFGAEQMRTPLSPQSLKLLVSMRKLQREMLARFGRLRRSYLVSEFLKTAIGKAVIRLKIRLAAMRGKTYLQEVISNADTLTLDGRINTIISATAAKRQIFTAFLSKLEAEKKLVYGHHINRESVMTCYIQSHHEKHVHFVDGGDGGYTAAAKELKKKFC